MIEILVEHPWFLVINKPSGLLTQAVPGIDSVQTMLVQQLKSRDAMSSTPFIGIPHRLDRPTSGAMVVARNQRALRRLSDQFASRKVVKNYFAIIPGMRQADEIIWRDFIRKVPDEPKAELVPESSDGAKEAVLRFHVRTQTTINTVVSDQIVSIPVTIVDVVLETGRMHQIRIQFASRSYPILGDSLYGSEIPWLQSELGVRESPIALHAGKIEFYNPQNAEKVTAAAPMPNGWPSVS